MGLTTFHRHVFTMQDGVASPDDVDTAISQGLGLRYSFSGVFETMHLNAAGMGDYCQCYGENIVTVCESEAPPRYVHLHKLFGSLHVDIHVHVQWNPSIVDTIRE